MVRLAHCNHSGVPMSRPSRVSPEGGSTLIDLVDEPWSHVSTLLPPGIYVPSIFVAHRVQHSHCSSILIECSYHNSRSRASRLSILRKKKPLLVRACMHSVRLEPTKLVLIGTRTTYRATGDAGCYHHVALKKIYHTSSK